MSHDRFHALTDEQLDWVDAACTDLEESWKRGESASLEMKFAEADPAVRSFLLRELLAAEIEWRRSRGERPRPADYQSRFPDHVEQIQQAFGLAGDSDYTLAFTPTVPVDDTGLSMSLETIGQPPSPLSRTMAFESLPEGQPKQFGRYLLVRLLGRGGMGSVFLAHDQELDRDVAIKFPEFDNQPEIKAVRSRPVAIERFRREARAMATLQHPNLCPVYDVGHFDGRHFLTMAYVKGETLTNVELSQSR